MDAGEQRAVWGVMDLGEQRVIRWIQWVVEGGLDAGEHRGCMERGECR